MLFSGQQIPRGLALFPLFEAVEKTGALNLKREPVGGTFHFSGLHRVDKSWKSHLGSHFHNSLPVGRFLMGSYVVF